MRSKIKHHFNTILSLKKSHIILISIAFILSISMISAQRFFNTTLNHELTSTSASLLTADLEIASSTPLDEKNISTIESIIPSHNIAERQIYSTMIQYYGGYDSKLVELVAISNNYPLRGTCLAQQKNGTIHTIAHLLKTTKNAVIVSKELMDQTDITFGSTIQIGKFNGIVTGVIKEEPDVNIQSLALGPRIYISLKNSQTTGFDPTVSRMYHSRFYAFNHTTDITSIGSAIETSLNISANDKTIQGSYGPSQPIVVRTYIDLTNSVIEGFDKLNEFYIFLSLFTLFMCGTGFAFIIWSSIIQQLHNIGNLRFLGISIQTIQNYYLELAFKITAIITPLGIILGGIISQIVYSVIAKINNFSPTFIHIALYDLLFIIAFSSIIIIAITYTMIRLLNNELNHFNVEQKQTVSLITIISSCTIMFSLVVIFLILNELSIKAMALILGSFSGIFILLAILDITIFPQFKWFYKTKLPLQFKLAMKCLSESHTMRRLSFISISLALITILGIGHYELSLSKEFNPNTGKSNLPNIFFIDLYKSQLESFNKTVSEKHKLAMMVRTRIKKVNNIHIHEYAKTLPNDYFLYREQNLTSRATLNESEELINGTWFDPGNGIIECSIEERFARRLKLSLGDTIEFNFYGIPFTVTITSIRTVDWGTFEPNFFLLIEPPHLDFAPQSWVGSIYTNSDKETQSIQNKLASKFPNVTTIDINKTSKKVLNFLKTFLLSIKIGSLMCFFIGALLFALLTKLYQDYRKDAFSMLYWAGMSKTKINQITFIEQVSFIFITFILSWAISVGIIKLLFSLIIHIPLHINWYVTGVTALGLFILSTIYLSITNDTQ